VLLVVVPNDLTDNLDERGPRFRLYDGRLVATNLPLGRRKNVVGEWLQGHSRLFAHGQPVLRKYTNRYRTGRAVVLFGGRGASRLACDTSLCNHEDCDAKAHFKVLNCILQSPVCKGESLPGGVTKRIARTRDVLSTASETAKPRHGRSLVSQGIRILKNTGKLVIGGRHRHKLSRQCVTELIDVLVQARHQCASWRGSF
jgi:hypothetical protein